MAEIQVGTRCLKCGMQLRIDPELIGLSIRCPVCNETFIVATISFSDTTGIEVPGRWERGGTIGEIASPDAPVDDAATGNQVDQSDTEQARLQDGYVSPFASSPTGKMGRFDVHEVLGRGGFGIVYHAYDPLLAREVALKLPLFAGTDVEKIRRFQNEARVAAQLRHPNIVAVYESGEIDGRLFLAAEYVRGQTLSDAIRSHPSFEQSVRWVHDLAAALAYAHEEGIVHRDIKPQNIMIDSSGRPQIMDFGLAKRLEHDSTMTAEGSLLGTPAYMSPEQARADGVEIGPDSDQYSLGVVLYELLTGRRPFDGPPAVVIAKVASAPAPAPRSINPNIPSDLEAICQKAIEKDPANRYSSAAAFARDLASWERGETTVVSPLTAVQRMRRWIGRSPEVAALIIALVTFLAIAALVNIAGDVMLSRSNADRERKRISARDQAKKAEDQTKEAEEAIRRTIEATQKVEEVTREAETADEKLTTAESTLEQARTERSRRQQQVREREQAVSAATLDRIRVRNIQLIFEKHLPEPLKNSLEDGNSN